MCEESGVKKSSSSLSSPKQIADPVVYKLVRVEGNGRLVPATDDEVMEVEDFLVDEAVELPVVPDAGNVRCISNEESSSGKPQKENSEGLSHSENTEADAKLSARLEYIEMLQKVKQEEGLHLACGSPDHSSFMNVDIQCSDQHDKLPAIDEKLHSEIHLQDIGPPSSLSPDGSHVNESGRIGECSKQPPDGPIESGSSACVICTSSKPDVNTLKGEICLDNLSIRELHELFRATFGRETTVKDKLWLKRRITMGLTNSCDVSTTTFTILDNNLVKKGKDDSIQNADGMLTEGSDGEAKNHGYETSPTSHSSQVENPHTLSGKRLGNSSVELDCGSEDLHTDQRAAKRVRKPTKRYIEELSEVESKDCSPKVISPVKNAGQGQTSLKSCRPLGNVQKATVTRLDPLGNVTNVPSNERTYVTRLDSLGGSGVQVPYVSRVRRSRPRKNIMALMLTAEPEKDKRRSVMGTIEPDKNMGMKQTDSSEDNSDDGTAQIPTAKGGMRRKHHRAWTLVEVIKLVEGVSKCGTGRWSEIKRLSFASYSYRTSVDLKTGSVPTSHLFQMQAFFELFAQPLTSNIAFKYIFQKCLYSINSRKHASVPIPASILLRVRELAEMHAQVPPNLGPSKPAIAMGIIERIKEIEAEMARTQKNKATEYHLGQLKAKIAKLRTQLLEPPKGSSGGGDGFEVTKFGHGRVALIGFPSVGKSTLLTMLTGTHSEAASYEFTTLTCIPGIIHYNDTKIQLLDLPGIIEGASEGKGRGRQVIAVAKSSDIVLMVLDASKSEGHRQILTKELEAVGLRLNKKPPQIYFKKKKTGGISFNSTLTLTHVDEKLCYQILHEYKIHNAELLFREDATVDDLIDVIEGNRKYMKCVYVYNKIDVIGIDDVDKLARQPNSVVISCNLKASFTLILNFDRLLAKMWEEMGLVRVYTKPQGQQPDFGDPVVLSADRGGCSVGDFCNHIHRSLVKEVKYVLVWGTSARHYPQHCGLGHVLNDEDVVQIVKKKDKEGEGRGRFKSHSTDPARISDRVKKAPLKQ
ncbi:unnamed protein product [Malus baccata var. baccata]